MWKKERDALYYSSKNSGFKRSGVKSPTPDFFAAFEGKKTLGKT